MVMARDPAKGKGLKEVPGVSEWRLHSEEEIRATRRDIGERLPWEQIHQKASHWSWRKSPRLERSALYQPSTTTTSMGEGSTPPLLYITSTFEGNGLQTIVLHAGGAWRICITPCRVLELCEPSLYNQNSSNDQASPPGSHLNTVSLSHSLDIEVCLSDIHGKAISDLC